MKELFRMLEGDLSTVKNKIVRNSSRAIIIKNGKIAMVYSKLYNYYKFPGGGIEKGESKIDALVREVREEAGLIVKKVTIKEFGSVYREYLSPDDDNTMYFQDNYYYLCDVEDEIVDQNLDEYEDIEGFSLFWVNPYDAINANRPFEHGPKSRSMIEREAKVLELLINQKYFD